MRLALARAARGNDVLALRRRDVAEDRGIRHLRVDLATGEGFDRLPRRPEALVFCAAPDERSESAYRALYVDGLRRLLDRLQVGRVLFVSSTAVYAQDAGEWVEEESPAQAASFNGRALLAAERELAGHESAASLRLSGLVGPGRDWMLRRARAGTANAPRWSNRIHVDDAAAALSTLLDQPGLQSVYLGNDDEPVRECDLQDWLRQREELAPITHLDGPESGRRVRNQRLRATGWVPAHPDFRAAYADLRVPGV